MATFSDSKIYKTKHVAEEVRTTEDWVWGEIRAGRLRAIKFGPRVIRIRGSDINEWLERGLTTPTVEEVSRG